MERVEAHPRVPVVVHDLSRRGVRRGRDHASDEERHDGGRADAQEELAWGEHRQLLLFDPRTTTTTTTDPYPHSHTCYRF